MQQIDWIVLAGIILFLCLMPIVLARCVKDLFRHPGSAGSGGGVIGALGVLDRIVNPAGEHVQEAQEVEQEEDGIGGE
ncbi:hypothetical protein Enr10x_26720 [Gimesia panareensis]|uniref:Uncharacterized protein n=1 Tax=Gimesia panareensis TaxID=2527978 RepID=A0A517Q6V7_9PLAN|nr:hypothetical protein [Gimesia panareensis]QDT27355.1 hypothetical protein Enr10x_26720 [Gimesia panareensis]